MVITFLALPTQKGMLKTIPLLQYFVWKKKPQNSFNTNLFEREIFLNEKCVDHGYETLKRC